MPTNNLTDAKCRAAKPGDKPYKLFDGGGLHLFVSPTGAKVWRLAYRSDGKPKTKSFGPFPEVSLVDARVKRDEAKAALRDGEDPRTRFIRLTELLKADPLTALPNPARGGQSPCFHREPPIAPCWLRLARYYCPRLAGLTPLLELCGGLGRCLSPAQPR